MRERLFIQYVGQEPVQAQLLDGQGRAAAGRFRGALKDVAPFMPQRQSVVIVPSPDIQFYLTAVPKASGERLRQAVPYLLEDNLLEPVEEYHFAMGARDEAGELPVSVIPHSLMQSWQARLHDAGIQPTVMVPDLLCLPWGEGRWSLYLDVDGVRLRHGRYSGYYSEWDNALLLLQSVIATTDPLPTRVDLYSPVDAVQLPHLSALKSLLLGQLGLDCEIQRAELFQLCIDHYRGEGTINLLQGRYRSRRAWQQQLGPWRMAAILSLVWLGVQLVDYGVGYWGLQHELTTLDERIEAEVRKGFPEIRTVVQPLNQVNTALGKLRASAGVTPFQRTLMAMGQALQGSQGTLEEVNYRNQQLVVRLRFPELQAVNAYEARLHAIGGIEVKVLAANKKDNAVEARIQIGGGTP